MTKRQPPQVVRDGAEQRKRHNDTHPIGMDRREADAGQEDVLAAEQWDEIIRLHIPGIALSGMPRIFELPVVLNGRPGVTYESIGDRATDQSRWSEIPNVLIAAIQEWDREAPTFSDVWTYESIIPANTVPDPNDEPNPRTYTLSGQLIRTLEDGNAIRMKVCSAFDHRLSELFRLSPNNTRERHVTARLQHHFDRGGNPTALLDYAEGLAMRWEADPPTYHEVRHFMDNNKRYPTVADSHILTRAIRQWVENARKAPSNNETPTFAELFGERLPDVLGAMHNAGIGYVPGRGKRKVVGALHGACDALRKPLPLATLWPVMLEKLYPGTVWSTKVRPIQNTREQEHAKDYMEAYRAIMDRLK